MKYKILNYIETQLLLKRFAYQVQSDYISRETNFWDTLYSAKYMGIWSNAFNMDKNYNFSK